MRIIGITGGIATGKSTVSAMLQDLYGVPVIYTDKVSRMVVEPGTDALHEIIKIFGTDILQKDGSMDRAKVRKICIHDVDKLDKLSSIVWPAIARVTMQLMGNFSKAGHKTICIENAILIEQGNHKLYDALVVVTCDPKTQLKRIMERDKQSEQDALLMINVQMPLSEKEALADFLVVNDGTMATLRKQVDALYRKVIREEDL